MDLILLTLAVLAVVYLVYRRSRTKRGGSLDLLYAAAVMNRDRALTEDVSEGFHTFPDGKREEWETVAEGKPGRFHRHNLKQMDWDQRHGKDFTDLSGAFATFRYLYRCSCGHEMILNRRALY